jgi:hypothetical protein
MRRRMHVREVIDFTFAFPRGAAPRPAQREGGRSAVGGTKKVRAPCKRPFPYSSQCHTEPGSRRLSARGIGSRARTKENSGHCPEDAVPPERPGRNLRASTCLHASRSSQRWVGFCLATTWDSSEARLCHSSAPSCAFEQPAVWAGALRFMKRDWDLDDGELEAIVAATKFGAMFGTFAGPSHACSAS